MFNATTPIKFYIYLVIEVYLIPTSMPSFFYSFSGTALLSLPEVL